MTGKSAKEVIMKQYRIYIKDTYAVVGRNQLCLKLKEDD